MHDISFKIHNTGITILSLFKSNFQKKITREFCLEELKKLTLATSTSRDTIVNQLTYLYKAELLSFNENDAAYKYTITDNGIMLIQALQRLNLDLANHKCDLKYYKNKNHHTLDYREESSLLSTQNEDILTPADKNISPKMADNNLTTTSTYIVDQTRNKPSKRALDSLKTKQRKNKKLKESSRDSSIYINDDSISTQEYTALYPTQSAKIPSSSELDIRFMQNTNTQPMMQVNISKKNYDLFLVSTFNNPQQELTDPITINEEIYGQISEPGNDDNQEAAAIFANSCLNI